VLMPVLHQHHQSTHPFVEHHIMLHVLLLHHYVQARPCNTAFHARIG
jgi:hypothetical protein